MATDDSRAGRCACDWGDSAPPEVNTANIHRPDCPAAEPYRPTAEDIKWARQATYYGRALGL